MLWTGLQSTTHSKFVAILFISFGATVVAQDWPSELGKSIRARRLDEKPYWHLERCRIEDSRKVLVELVVNGEVAGTKEIVANGEEVSIDWNVEIKESSWAAVRILPSMHSNPIFIEVDQQPIRANLKSVQW